MKPLIVAASLAAFLLVGCQTAEVAKTPAAQSCPTGTIAVSSLENFLNQSGMAASFDPPEAHAAAVVKTVNAAPPISDWAPDRVTVHYNQSYALLALYMGDCVAALGPVPGGVMSGFLRSVQSSTF